MKLKREDCLTYKCDFCNNYKTFKDMFNEDKCYACYDKYSSPLASDKVSNATEGSKLSDKGLEATPSKRVAEDINNNIYRKQTHNISLNRKEKEFLKVEKVKI